MLRDLVAATQGVIGATDTFILRPFLKGGALLGLGGALLSLILSGTLVWHLESVVAHVAVVFGTTFVLHGLSWDEAHPLAADFVHDRLACGLAGDGTTFMLVYT